jgi:hypothetical protein
MSVEREGEANYTQLGAAVLDLLVKEVQRDDYLEWKTPELVETLTEVDDAVSVGTHEIHHLQYTQSHTNVD